MFWSYFQLPWLPRHTANGYGIGDVAIFEKLISPKLLLNKVQKCDDKNYSLALFVVGTEVD